MKSSLKALGTGPILLQLMESRQGIYLPEFTVMVCIVLPNNTEKSGVTGKTRNPYEFVLERPTEIVGILACPGDYIVLAEKGVIIRHAGKDNDHSNYDAGSTFLCMLYDIV